MSSPRRLDVTREQVLAKLRVGLGWREAAAELNVLPGLAFMIASGIPADGSGVPELPQVADTDPLASPQSLLNDRGHNPLAHEDVDAWMRRRARRELTQ